MYDLDRLCIIPPHDRDVFLAGLHHDHVGGRGRYAVAVFAR